MYTCMWIYLHVWIHVIYNALFWGIANPDTRGGDENRSVNEPVKLILILSVLLISIQSHGIKKNMAKPHLPPTKPLNVEGIHINLVWDKLLTPSAVTLPWRGEAPTRKKGKEKLPRTGSGVGSFRMKMKKNELCQPSILAVVASSPTKFTSFYDFSYSF